MPPEQDGGEPPKKERQRFLLLTLNQPAAHAGSATYDNLPSKNAMLARAALNLCLP